MSATGMFDLAEPEVIAALDLAIATSHPVAFGDFVFVDDMALIEGIANGHPVPARTSRVRRHDGRTVYVYRHPAAVTR